MSSIGFEKGFVVSNSYVLIKKFVMDMKSSDA